MNDNQLILEYKFDNPNFAKLDCIIDKFYRDCYNKYFHKFVFICEYDLNFTNITNNESVIFTISDKIMGVYELNKKLTLARQRGFIFNQINNFKIKIYSNPSRINLDYHQKLGTSHLHRQFFKKISQHRDDILNFCNDMNNPFHFACRQWYSYNNPGILT